MTTSPAGTIELLVRHANGSATGDDAVTWATDALVDGFDSPSLRRLAGLNPPAVWFEAMPLFEQAVTELQLEVPHSKDEILRVFLRSVCPLLPSACLGTYTLNALQPEGFRFADSERDRVGINCSARSGAKTEMDTMNILLWVLQVLAALLYGASGVMKVFMFDKVSKDVPSFGALPRGAWMVLGILELVCTVGLIVPAALGRQPQLTIVAATVLAIESLVFIGVHVKYHEIPPIIMSGVLGLLMAFIAYGRMVLKPIF